MKYRRRLSAAYVLSPASAESMRALSFGSNLLLRLVRALALLSWRQYGQACARGFINAPYRRRHLSLMSLWRARLLSSINA